MDPLIDSPDLIEQIRGIEREQLRRYKERAEAAERANEALRMANSELEASCTAQREHVQLIAKDMASYGDRKPRLQDDKKICDLHSDPKSLRKPS